MGVHRQWTIRELKFPESPVVTIDALAAVFQQFEKLSQDERLIPEDYVKPYLNSQQKGAMGSDLEVGPATKH